MDVNEAAVRLGCHLFATPALGVSGIDPGTAEARYPLKPT